MRTVHILLPVHNRRAVTARFIAALKAQTYRHYHLVLIDDGSTDGTEEMVRSEIASLTVLSGSGDWWWAGALQQGYEWLRRQSAGQSDLVLIINDDTEFAVDFLAHAVNLMRGTQETLLLAKSFGRSTGQLVGGGVRVDWRRLRFSPATAPHEIDCLSTRGLFLTVKDFLDLGGFYPKLLPHYLSDYEFTLRAKRRGLQLRVDDCLGLKVDEETTGFHQFEGESFRAFLKKYFAKNSDANPLAWTAFIALACPWPWKLPSWLRIWYGTGKKLLSAALT